MQRLTECVSSTETRADGSRQARAPGNLFGRLKRQLEELGHDFSGLEDYMEKAVRTNVTMAAMTPNDEYCDVVNHEFEEGMAEEVARRLTRRSVLQAFKSRFNSSPGSDASIRLEPMRNP